MAKRPKSPPPAPQTLAVTYREAAELTPHGKNARTHSDAQVAQIAASMTEFGWTNPVLIDEAGGVIAGHGRLMAAKLLGMATVPTIALPGLTPAQKRALVIADNKLALNAGWDDATLGEELAGLCADGFNMEILGFDGDELAALLADPTAGRADLDEMPPIPADPVTALGDVWLCGRHRVICGDGTDVGVIEQLCGETVPDIAISDPPYGISIVKGASDGGAKPFGTKRGRVHGPARNAIIRPGVYAPIIGDDTTETAIASYHALVALGVPAIVLWGGNYFADQLPPSRCWLVWDKENTGTFADAELAWTNQDAIVRLLRHQWSGLIKASERGERRVHPTQKPVALAEWVIETVAPKAASVIDPFLGSGWTLIAAERRGIQHFGIELSPPYVDCAVQRWQAFTGKTATRDSDGAAMPDLIAARDEELAA
jgi:hypothetical protein